MEAESLLNQLCARHGVDPASGARLLPLVRWALEAPPESRERILQVVENQLRGEPQEGELNASGDRQVAAEHAVLVAVAKVLHQWNPKLSLLDLDQITEDEGEAEEGAA
jgi:hypothetical protein